MIDPNEFDDFAQEVTREFHHQCKHCPESRRSKAALAAHIYRAHTGKAATAPVRLEVAGQVIEAMSRTLTDIAERMQRLDAAATSPAAVRRATLNDVVDRLREVGDYAGCATIQRMILEEGN